MEHFSKRRAIGICAVLALLAGCGGHGAVIPAQVAGQGSGFQSSRVQGVSGLPESGRYELRFLTLRPDNVDFASLDAQRAASLTIPFYSGTIKSPLDKVTYSYRIAGSDPTKSNATTRILYMPIALRVRFADGTVLDPTKPSCGDSVSVMDRLFKGPNFAPVAMISNGVNVGKVQITDGFQRAEFWKALKGRGYHTVLKAAAAPAVVDVTAPPGARTESFTCSGRSQKFGKIDYNAVNNIIKALAKKRVKTNQVAIFLTYDVFETENGRCCAGGFHDSFGSGGGTQVYSIGAYINRDLAKDKFGDASLADIDVWTHELGDLLDDPFPGDASNGNNVPPWGGVGQVPKGRCQGNLETGDPLTLTAFEVRYNGFTYHPQELAFFSWFYRTPSIGTGGKFSLKGTFTHGQGPCFSQ